MLVAEHAFMIDEFLAKLDADGELEIGWKQGPGPEVFFHGHCHQKALIGTGPSLAVLKAAGCTGRDSGAGCCGMAGSFGYETEHYDVSRLVGEERLFPAVKAASPETVIAVAGVSCRQQIEHFTDRSTRHIAEVLASRIARDHVWQPAAPEPIPAGVTPTPEVVVHAESMTDGTA
jgi:Fe-S oxidoreductase